MKEEMIFITVKVEDELPELTGEYFVITTCEGFRTQELFTYDIVSKYWYSGVRQIQEHVTHWLKPVSKREYLQKMLEDAWDAGYQRSYSGYPNTDNHTKPNKQQYIKQILGEPQQ